MPHVLPFMCKNHVSLGFLQMKRNIDPGSKNPKDKGRYDPVTFPKVSLHKHGLSNEPLHANVGNHADAKYGKYTCHPQYEKRDDKAGGTQDVFIRLFCQSI